ncbi:glyceraldehyde-3-phosphate dehydrogenase isoform X1 [Canis aureus]
MGRDFRPHVPRSRPAAAAERGTVSRPGRRSPQLSRSDLVGGLRPARPPGPAPPGAQHCAHGARFVPPVIGSARCSSSQGGVTFSAEAAPTVGRLRAAPEPPGPPALRLTRSPAHRGREPGPRGGGSGGWAGPGGRRLTPPTPPGRLLRGSPVTTAEPGEVSQASRLSASQKKGTGVAACSGEGSRLRLPIPPAPRAPPCHPCGNANGRGSRRPPSSPGAGLAARRAPSELAAPTGPVSVPSPTPSPAHPLGARALGPQTRPKEKKGGPATRGFTGARSSGLRALGPRLGERAGGGARAPPPPRRARRYKSSPQRPPALSAPPRPTDSRVFCCSPRRVPEARW